MGGKDRLELDRETVRLVGALVLRARVAQRAIDNWSQQQVDEVVTAAGWAIIHPEHNRMLAGIAVRDTGLGNVADKIAKNRRKTIGLLDDLRGAKSVGVIAELPELGLTEIARPVGVVAAVTGPVDQVSDGRTVLSVSNGDAMLATVTGTGCMSSALTGCFLAVKPESPLEAAAEALAAFGVAGEDAARDAKGPGSFHVGLYDALAALDPETLDSRSRIG